MPFFNILAFIIGTWINSQTKKKRLAALRRKVSPFSSDALDISLTGNSITVMMEEVVLAETRNIRSAIIRDTMMITRL